MSQISDLAKTMGKILGARPSMMFLPKSVAAAALKHEEAILAGKALGLSDEQVREVITEVAAGPWPLDIWDQIQRRLILRAMDLEWRP